MKPEDQCMRPEEMDLLRTLPSTDRRHAHVRSCPRCRALLEAHRLFHAPSPEELEAPHVQAANVALSAHVARLTTPAQSVVAAPSEPWWRIFLTPAMRPAMAFAVLTIVLGSVLLGPRILPRDNVPVLRGEASASLALEPVHQRADGTLALQWQQVPGATHYRIEFYSTSLEALGQTPELTATNVVLPLARIPTAARTGNLLIRVIALRDGEELSRSDTQPLLR